MEDPLAVAETCQFVQVLVREKLDASADDIDALRTTEDEEVDQSAHECEGS